MGKILVHVFHQYIRNNDAFHILPQILQPFVLFHFHFGINVEILVLKILKLNFKSDILLRWHYILLQRMN